MIAPRPNPVQAPASGLRGDADRDVGCAFYERCLDKAARANWPAFTCQRCELRGVAANAELRLDPWARTGDPMSAEAPTSTRRRPGPSPDSPMRGGFYLDVLERMTRGEDFTIDALARLLGVDTQRIRTALQTLAHRKLIKNTGRGLWRRP